MTSPLKIFLSYSHADEAVLDKFKKHLTPVIRQEIVDIWYDRNLLPGSELDENIVTKLDEAEIVIFLVSSDFLASYYCVEIELMRTLKRKAHSDICIIPMIVRSCDWKSSELKNYTAIPKDGKAIASHNDVDAALYECVDQLKKVVKNLQGLLAKDISIGPDEITHSTFSLNNNFLKFLEDTEIVFQHKNKEFVYQSDIFIYPDLRSFNKNDDDSAQLVTDASKVLYDPLPDSNILLIFGGEQSGKKALAKRAFFDNYENGLHPVYIGCETIPTSIDVEKLVTKAIKEQYESCTFESYTANKDQSILILTGFNHIKLNAKHQRVLLSRLERIFIRILIFADSELRYNDQSFAVFEEYNIYEILRLSYLKKDELISKWNSLGVIETIDEKELHALNDQSRQHVDSIVKRNILPSKPIFVLTVLQTLETIKTTDYKLTSHGHCYEHLIQQSLIKAKICHDDFGTYINYLTELAYFIYKKGGYRIISSELDEFQKGYSKNYLIQSNSRVHSKLLASGILKVSDQQTHFGYKYIFYFYIAKYLADNITFDNAKKVIASLCEKIHTEKHANILIFVTHHTKSQDVLDEVLLHASLIFENHQPNKLSVDDFEHIKDLLKSIPSLIIEHKNIDHERKKKLAQMDRVEGHQSDLDTVEEMTDTQDDKEEQFQNTGLAQINSSVKAVEIIGQILRNRHGNLTKSQLTDLAEASIDVGLRFLDFYLNFHASSENEIIQLISELIESDSRIPNEQITKVARNFYVHMCYEITFAVLKKISFSVGSDKLVGIFDEIVQKNDDSAALQLINLAIKFEFTEEIPFELLDKMTVDFKSNFVAKRMMQQIVVQHLYLHHVSRTDKQKIADLIGIPMDRQRQIQGQKKLKSTEKS